MPRAYSRDLRERVVGAVEAGQTRHAAARTFGVSVSSVVKWVQQFRESGRVAAKPMGGRRPYALAGHRVFVLGRLAEKTDLTISVLEAELAERGVKVSRYAVWHFLKHEGLSFKKSLHASEQDRPDVQRRRSRWKRHLGKLAPDRLVFIDETWAKTNMTRTHGRCPKDKRLVAKVPCGRWRTLTGLAALGSIRLIVCD